MSRKVSNPSRSFSMSDAPPQQRNTYEPPSILQEVPESYQIPKQKPLATIDMKKADPGPGAETARFLNLKLNEETDDAEPPMRNVMDRFSLAGKVALVTGAARGLGFAMAHALCQAGVRQLAILDILDEHGDVACKTLYDQYGCQTVYHHIDVREEVPLQAIFDSVAATFGKIDVVINAAGVADCTRAEEVDSARFRRIMDINVTGTHLVCAAACRVMKSTKTGGSIINIASMSGHIVNWPQPQAPYNASKAAVIMYTKSLAVEWAKYDIRVNSISPGYMDTLLTRGPKYDALREGWKHKTPQGRLGAIDDLNGVAVLLASDAGANITGSDYIIDGGYTCP